MPREQQRLRRARLPVFMISIVEIWMPHDTMEIVGEMRKSDRAVRLAVYQSEASTCTVCREHDLLHVDDHNGSARPILQRSPTGILGILIVGEAPNWDDSFDPQKGHLTYDADTDPTGRFMRCC